MSTSLANDPYSTIHHTWLICATCSICLRASFSFDTKSCNSGTEQTNFTCSESEHSEGPSVSSCRETRGVDVCSLQLAWNERIRCQSSGKVYSISSKKTNHITHDVIHNQPHLDSVVECPLNIHNVWGVEANITKRSLDLGQTV